MALPSARRPPEVEELLKEDTVKAAGVSLKLKVNLSDAFFSQMVYWYEGLKTERLKELTKKKVMLKASDVARELHLLYKQLPNDWLQTLHEKHGLKFKVTSSKKKKNRPIDNSKLENGPPAPSSSNTATKTRFDSKLIDLTDEPPPQAWLDIYMNGQKFPPRLLKTHTMPDDVTIVYYDYSDESVKPAKSEQRCEKSQAHDRDGIWGKKI